MLNCHSNTARKLQNDADACKDLAEKSSLYLKASKEFLIAAQSSQDKTLQMSLVYLSASAVYKANMIKQLRQKTDGNIAMQSEVINKAFGKSKVSGPISAVTDNLVDKRLSFQSKVTGINKIPKATEVSPSNLVRDLLILEAKLCDLGLDKDGFFHKELARNQCSSALQSGSTLPSKSSTAGMTSLGQSTFHLSSDLGESFMMLKPTHTAGTLKQQSVSNVDSMVSNAAVNKPVIMSSQRSANDGIASLKPVSSGTNDNSPTVYGGGNSNKIRNLSEQSSSNNTRHDNNNNVQKHKSEIPQSEVNSGTGWANTVFTWGGFGVGTPPTAGGNNTNAEANRISQLDSKVRDLPNWNEQSIMLPSTAGNKVDQSTMSAATCDDMTRSTISTINSEAQRNVEGVANLLQTVRRLGEENAHLSSRIEQLTIQREAHARQLYSEINTFKQDYNEKFRRVKRALKDYVATYQRDDNPAMQGSLAALETLQVQAEAKLKEIRDASDVVATSVSATGTKSGSTSNSTATIASDGNKDAGKNSASSSSSSSSEVERRQRELERTVQALVARLQKANEEIKKKDIIIRTLDPTAASDGNQQPQLRQQYNSAKPPHQGQVTSSQQQQQHRGSGGMRSPNPQQKIVMPMRPHSSTATLESLQKNSK